MPPKRPTLVGLRFLCPGSVFKVPDAVYPGVVTGKASRASHLYVRFDGEEDRRTYYFAAADVARWVAAADAAGMNDRESDSDDSEGGAGDAGSDDDGFEVDLGAPSPDAPRSGWRRRGGGGQAEAATATKGGGRASGRTTAPLFPGRPTDPSSASPKRRTASLNSLSSGGRGGGASARSDAKRAAAAAAPPRRQQGKGPPPPPSPPRSSALGFAVVPLLASLAALGAFAVSWLVLQRVPEPQRVLRFRVPW